MICERVLAGIARARSKGRALGRKRLEETNAAKVSTIRTARAKGLGLRRIATDLHVGVGTVLRVLGEGKHREAMGPDEWPWPRAGLCALVAKGSERPSQQEGQRAGRMRAGLRCARWV